MNIETIKEILYNQAIDGEFSETNNAIKLIKAMTKTQQEVIMAAYLIERNNSLDVSLGERGMTVYELTKWRKGDYVFSELTVALYASWKDANLRKRYCEMNDDGVYDYCIYTRTVIPET